MSDTAFYTLADERYFLGAVGLVNSLRLQGHEEPIHLLDLGLSAEQRELLAPEVELLAAPPGIAPWLAKTIAPLARPAEVMVLIDADMIATRHLGELIETAREGRVVAFATDLIRHLAEWSELLDLGPIEPRTYLSSAFVAAAHDPGAGLLATMDDRQRRIEVSRTFAADDDASYPLRFLDQDVFNAVLASSLARERIVELDSRLGWSLAFDEPEIVDPLALRCRFRDATEPFVIHQLWAKPWLEPVYDGVYSRLLKRLLVGPGLAIEVPARAVPLRLRAGRLALLERRRVDAMVRLRWALGIRAGWLRARAGLPPGYDSPPRT